MTSISRAAALPTSSPTHTLARPLELFNRITLQTNKAYSYMIGFYPDIHRGLITWYVEKQELCC